MRILLIFFQVIKTYCLSTWYNLLETRIVNIFILEMVYKAKLITLLISVKTAYFYIYIISNHTLSILKEVIA